MIITTLKDLFEHELQDMYSAEKQILRAIPNMIEKTSNSDLKKALREHLEQTEEHVKKLEGIAKSLDLKVSGESCKGMQGVIEEGEEIVQMIDDSVVRDAAIIMAVQRIEHYEIAGYGTLAAHANELGMDEIAHTCVEIDAQEYEADSILTEIAESGVNAEAKDSIGGKLYA